MVSAAEVLSERRFSPPAEQPRLLLVDDEVESAQALALYLIRQGYDVMTVYNGKAAIEAIQAYHPHLVILDLLIPDKSGLEVTMWIRANPSLVYLPVIVVTGHDEERKRLQSMVSGADDYLEKPVNERELLVRVQALLRTKAHIDRLWEENHALLRDLEQRNAELEQALNAVERANLLKQNILNSVSHEMGTPMLQVKSAVHLLVEDIRKSDPHSKAASLVTRAVGRLEGVISNLTDLARSESLKCEPIVLSDALDLALRNVERVWAGDLSEDRFQRRVEAGLPLVLGDRRAVARVLSALIENALKFDPSGQPIQLELRRADAKQVQVSVRDHGIGIPPDQLERIFDEFYQIDSSTVRRYGGSGLGLALVKLLCDRLGTKIHVESQLHKGSHFWFTLPIASL
jgi:signal transduction histidine kinase